MSIEVRGLRKAFGSTVVCDQLDLDIPSGELVALLGPSGSGKTTLLRIIAGLEVPDAGSVLFHGEDTTNTDVRERHVGFVFQHYALFGHMTIFENVAFGLRVRPKETRPAEAVIRRKVTELLELVQLGPLATRYPHQLSGGQRQRVALARALAVEPSLILLDEPFSALDAPLRAELRGEVRRLLAAAGATAVFVTHDQEEAFLIGDQVALMLDGRIAQVGTPDDLYERPASRAVARFVGDANILPARAAGGFAETPVGKVPLAREAHGDVEVMLRPECIAACDGDEAIVERIEYYGHDAVIVATCRGCPVRCRVMGKPQWDAGDTVSFQYVGAPSVAFDPAEHLTTA